MWSNKPVIQTGSDIQNRSALSVENCADTHCANSNALTKQTQLPRFTEILSDALLIRIFKKIQFLLQG
ncbi:MAG: hypothetical protein ACPHO8_17460, partial [Mariniblastus sp.]